MLKMACAGCGAPLEIGEDLDSFACSYCGVNQQVERKGGIVALRKVEAVLQSVQRGTDRTAAELTLARLTKELAEAEEKKQQAFTIISARIEAAERQRMVRAALAAIAVLVAGLMILGSMFGSRAVRDIPGILFLVVFGIAIAAGVIVFNKSPVSTEELAKSQEQWNIYIDGLKAQVASTRASLG